MRGTQQTTNANGTATTQPIDVSWQTGLDANGKENLIAIDGGVVAKSTLEDGSISEVLGNQMTIALADPPTDAPADAAPKNRKPARNAFAIGPADADSTAFRDKIFKLATVESSPENSEVRSTLLAEDGSLLRRLHLFATKLQYEPETKRLVVPVPGRMLYEDNRAPTTQPADSKLSLVGATAFEWKKDFIYDDTAGQATMSGDVDIVHKGSAAADNYRMHAQRVVAELMPADAPNDKLPAGKRPPPQPSSEAKLKRLLADGGVTFGSSKIQFAADQVEFDPTKHLLIARAPIAHGNAA